jgi:hypothetical protein
MIISDEYREVYHFREESLERALVYAMHIDYSELPMVAAD